MRVLFGRHQLRLYRFIVRILNDGTLAEDLVNDVFLAVWRQAARFEGRSTVLTWLLAIARLKAIAKVRGRKETNLDVSAAYQIPDNAASEQALDAKDRSQLIRSCISRLSPEQTEIIDLVYYHERSVSDVAKIVGIPEATVKTRMFYARKKLGELLGALGEGNPPGRQDARPQYLSTHVL
jgi:RNA polymerase sigma-70 factor (ECF subfamily)